MDWQLTCRVCLETGDMVSLFDWDENNEQLADKYTFCCGVEVAKKDTLPTLICLNCVDRLTFSYQFKQQCLSSNDTLKECLDEFLKTSTAVPETSRQGTDTETITIKQENGMLLQYELPVEHDPQTTWTNTKEPSSSNSVVSKAPLPKKRGRPRKYPNEQGQIHVSPYQRKKPKQPQVEEEALTTLLATGNIDMKQEPDDEFDNEELGAGGVDDDDPDFNPEEHGQEDIMEPPKKKRGRPRKIREEKEKSDEEENNGEDMLLKETIMAFSEPIPDHILNPKPKKKYPKKKYHYEKTHVCETCGSAFTSNASLQAHIRRHLGIKPFVCSLCGYSCVMNMELRRHMMRHTGVKPYKCRICDRRFGDFGSRQKHESVCGYSANASLTLRRHMIRKHTNERNYPCRHCDRRFVEYGDRQKYEWLHMGVRPYKCTLCTKSFTYSYVLANHMLTHTGEKKFSCEPCNRKFTKSHHLKYHNKVHHKELYIQQQLEQDAKKMRQQINVNNLSEVLSGTIVDGSLRLGSQAEEESEEGQRNLVVQGDFQEENQEDDEGKETDRAVAGMQEVMMGSDYEIEEDIKPE